MLEAVEDRLHLPLERHGTAVGCFARGEPPLRGALLHALADERTPDEEHGEQGDERREAQALHAKIQRQPTLSVRRRAGLSVRKSSKARLSSPNATTTVAPANHSRVAVSGSRVPVAMSTTCGTMRPRE